MISRIPLHLLAPGQVKAMQVYGEIISLLLRVRLASPAKIHLHDDKAPQRHSLCHRAHFTEED